MSQSIVLTISQHTPDTPGQTNKPPMVIPFVIGFVGGDGWNIEHTLVLTKAKEFFFFNDIPEEPALSLNRRFAPVHVKYDYREGELAFLARHDPCPFSRWDAMQTLAKEVLHDLYLDVEVGRELVLDERLSDVFDSVLTDKSMELDLKTEMLTLPSEKEISNEIEEVDPVAVHTAREFVKRELAGRFSYEFGDLYDEYHSTEMPGNVAKRAIANLALAYLAAYGYTDDVLGQFASASNMTDEIAALSLLVYGDDSHGEVALRTFYEEYERYENVIDKWLAMQATNPNAGTLEKVKALMGHPSFSWTIPNRLRSLIGAFAMANPVQFHDISGEGYKFLVDVLIKYDAINPGVASRLVEAITDWKKYNTPRQKLMLAELLRLNAEPKLSVETRDKVCKALRVLYESYFAQ